MSTKSKEPKSNKSNVDFKLGFGKMSKEDKQHACVLETQALVRALFALADSLKAMNADAFYISKTEEQVRELREEYNRLILADKQNPDATQMKALRDKARIVEKEVKNYFCDRALEELKQYRGKTLPEEQFNELVKLKKTSEVEFQQKVVKSLHEQQWIEIQPVVVKCCAEAKKLGFAISFQALGRHKLAEQTKGLATLNVDAATATSPYRLDFKAAVRCGNTIISQFKILEAEFKQIVEEPTGSVREFVANPNQQNNRFQAEVASEGMLGAPKLGPGNFSAVADWYTRAIEVEKSGSRNQSLQFARLGIAAFGELQAAWQDYLLDVKLWDETEGTRIKNQTSLRAIVVDQIQRKRKQQLDPAVENAAADYLRSQAGIEKLAAGKTVKGKLDALTAWRNQKPALDNLQKTAENGYIAQLNPKPTEEWNTAKEQNPNGPEAVYQRAIPDASPKLAKFRLLAAKGNNVRMPKDLSLGEVAAITAYTNDTHCKIINGALNGTPVQGATPEDIEAYKELAKVAAEALKKLPTYPNETERGEKLWSGAEERYQVDNEFAIKAFWSTSFGAQFPGLYQITIKPKNKGAGKNVQVLSELPKENEILFPPGTKFRVVTVEGTIEEGRIKVKLLEI
jgi:hypothetical protein